MSEDMLGILSSPSMSRHSSEFINYLTEEWKLGVNRYFKKAETNYPGRGAMSRAYLSTRGDTKLSGALDVRWDENRVFMNIVKMNVPSLKGDADLVEILGGPQHRETKKKYVVWRNRRIPAGYRKMHDRRIWNKWWGEFVNTVDERIEQLADDLAVSLAEEF